MDVDGRGDRVTSYEVMNHAPAGSQAVGLFNTTTRQYQPYDRAVLWPGNAPSAPVDYVPSDLESRRVSKSLVAGVIFAVMLRWGKAITL